MAITNKVVSKIPDDSMPVFKSIWRVVLIMGIKMMVVMVPVF